MASPHVAGTAALLASEENPEDLEDVEAIRSTIEEEGSQAWEDTSGDGVKEPLLDVSDEEAFAPADQRVASERPEIVSSTEAVLRGAVNPGGAETEYYFEYGPSAEYGSKIPASPEEAGSGTAYVPVEETLGGLEGGVGYHFRLIAVNSEGTFHSPDRLFGTTPPAVSTESATEITANDAALNATVDPGGLTPTYSFEFGTTASYGRKTPQRSLSASSSGVAVGDSVALDESTTYHYRVVAESSAGTTYGEDETLTTSVPGEWAIQATPVPGGIEKDNLRSVSCASATDCVAVGGVADTGGINRGLIQHWDGDGWGDVPTPEGEAMEFKQVSCASPAWCVAIGTHYDETAEEVTGGIIEQWDGESWQVAPFPLPAGSARAYLGDVSCTSSTACLAVGEYRTDTSKWQLLAERWDGEEWRMVEAPEQFAEGTSNSLRGVSCLSSTTCLVLGEIYSGARYAVWWNAGEWTTEPLPEALGSVGSGGRVSCASAAFCVALGGRTSSDGAMTAVWDGEGWSLHETPKAPGTTRVLALADVSCPTADACTLVGSVDLKEHHPEETGLIRIIEVVSYIAAWNGEQWTLQQHSRPVLSLSPSKTPVPGSFFGGVSCLTSGRCTAVGYSALDGSSASGGQYASLVERFRTRPGAATEPATQVTNGSAELHAGVNPEGLDTTYHFEYDTAEYGDGEGPHGTSVPAEGEDIGAGSSVVGVDQAVAGLRPHTTYHFRIVATNAEGTTYGEDQDSFSTPATCTAAVNPHIPCVEAETYPAKVVNQALSAQFLHIGEGEKALTIGCYTLELSGELDQEGPGTGISFTPDYRTCEDQWSYKVNFAANGCHYELHVDNAGPPYQGDLSIACAEEGEGLQFFVRNIFDTKDNCRVELPEQSLGTVELANVGKEAERGIQLEADLEGVAYTTTPLAGIGCPGKEEEVSGEDGSYEGYVVMHGEDAAEERQGVFLSGEESSALFVAPPSGPEFLAETYPAKVVNQALSAQFLHIGEGEKALTIGCYTLELSGELDQEGPGTGISFTPDYRTCEDQWSYKVNFAANGCHYELHVHNAGPPYQGDLSIACAEEGEGLQFFVRNIFDTKDNCRVELPEQSLGTVELANVGKEAERGIQLEADLEGVAYTTTPLAGIGCPGKEEEVSGEDGSYEGYVVMHGEDAAEERQGVFLSGEESSASLEADAYPSVLAGGSLQSHTLTLDGGQLAIDCGSVTLEGGLETGAGSEVSLSPSYEGCTYLNAFYNKVNFVANGCHYELHVNNAGPPYQGDLSIACAEEGEGLQFFVRNIFDTKDNCRVELPEQSLGTVELANVGKEAERGIQLEADLEGVAYTTTPLAGIGCPGKEEEVSGEDGEYEGSETIWGFD